LLKIYLKDGEWKGEKRGNRKKSISKLENLRVIVISFTNQEALIPVYSGKIVFAALISVPFETLKTAPVPPDPIRLSILSEKIILINQLSEPNIPQ
jgi:hypothetical protein